MKLFLLLLCSLGTAMSSNETAESTQVWTNMKVRLSLDKKTKYKLEFYARKGNNTTTIELKLASGKFIDHWKLECQECPPLEKGKWRVI